MIYPRNFEQKVGFDQIRELIAEKCISPMGRRFTEKIRFSAKREVIENMLDQTVEFGQILSLGLPFPAKDYFDLREELAPLKTPGTYISQEALFRLRSSLETILEILRFFDEAEEGAFPELRKLAGEVFIPGELLPQADGIIDNKGEIKDKASDKLFEIRKAITARQRQVLREAQKAFTLAKKSGWVPKQAELTLRDGRPVIPLNAADKRALGGVIHDESATGQTVFLEPTAAFELNNEIRSLESEEGREIVQILTRFTDRLRPYLQHLSEAFRFLGLVDFIRAKALFAQKTNGVKPVFASGNYLKIKSAVHPLLLLSHRAQNKEVVPLDLELDENNRILVISGPNAGGKSVCLKTTGLLQYMLQCGLPVPASPNSEFRIFSRLFIDIGDEQSIENDLSTYSSHLLNMKHFLRHANAGTLLLIDEFGTGTEPQLGGSIAEAILEQLNKKEAFGLITTHYTNLKLAAERLPGMVNGAMLFDSKAMQPLYKLQIGKPGSSFAFEIAKKIGFPSYVLQRAKKKSGGKHVRFDQQLQQLETDKLQLSKKQSLLDTANESLSQMIEKYTGLVQKLEQERKQIIREAKQEALEIITGSNKAVEKTIREIKEAGADKEKTIMLRRQLADKKEQLQQESAKKPAKPEKRTAEKSPEPPVDFRPKPGDFVRVQDTDIIGELILTEGDTALLNVNEVRLKTAVEKLLPAGTAAKQTLPRHKRKKSIAVDLNEKAGCFALTLDLRGKRAEEALAILGSYIDDAIMLSIKEVRILHGKGFGILREVIREYLQSLPEIRKFGDAPLDQGGAGITVVIFK
ncbi:MAG: Smr/MutS family protein [Bacteroidales bacterium]|nr:Smr/MutS family protein [Bacteroidales bacterium]